MSECFMISEPILGGGGNRASRATTAKESIVIRRFAGVGDVVAASIISDRLDDLGYRSHFHSHENCHSAIRRCRGVEYVNVPNGTQHVNLDNAYEKDPQRKEKHLFEMLMDSANRQLSRLGIDLGNSANSKPQLRVSAEEKILPETKLHHYPRPWVMICPRSNSYKNRQISHGLWEEIAKRIHGTKFWLDHLHDPPPGIVDLKARSIEAVMLWLSVADLLVTVDTGPMHLSAALNVPVVAVLQSNHPDLRLSPQSDFVTVQGDLECLNCQKNICPISEVMPPCQDIDPDLVASWANARLWGIEGNGISAVIPIYQPTAERLNRCLAAALPQVDEIVVTMELNSILPEGAMRHDKIKYVRLNRSGVGYGPNSNYGARLTNGRLLWFLNDDCYADANCVRYMLAALRHDVALVGHLLRFADSRIQHAGMERNGTGYGHIDYGKYITQASLRWKEPREVEMCTSASVLVRRKAFFDCGAFPEDHFMYSEDTHLCLNLRKAGWKIIYTPHATAIHDEHQSSGKLGDIGTLVAKGNAVFGARWQRYFEHNRGNPGLGNFNYLKA